MTSKISFFKLLREDLKRKTWLLILAGLVFFISFPIVFLFLIDNAQNFSEYLTQEEIQIRMQGYFLGLMGYQNIWMVFVTIVGASLCGIFCFSYLYNKKKVDFYHSIPVRREKLFLVSYLNGLLIYVVPYLISIAICLLLGMGYFSIDSIVLKTVFQEFGVQLLYYLLIYHAAILTTILAGNMFGCLFLNGLVQSYAFAVFIIFQSFAESCFQTYYNAADPIDKISGFSPVFAFVNTIIRLAGNDDFYQFQLRKGEVSTNLFLMQSAVAAILLLGAALWLFRIRAGEMAGKAIAFPKLQPIIRILVVIPSAITIGWIFASITVRNMMGWMIFGILFGAILVHGIIEVLYQADIRGIFSHKLQLAGSIVVAIIITLTASNHIDWIGYDTYLPKQEKIESAAISINGITNNIPYNWVSEDSNGDIQSHSISARTYQLEEMELTGDLLPYVYQLMSIGVEQEKANKSKAISYTDFRGNEYLTSDEISDLVQLYIKIRLKGGKEVTRTYSVSMKQVFDLLSLLFDSQELKETIYANFLENIPNILEVNVYGRQGACDPFTEEEKTELLEAYKSDLMKLTLEDIRENPVVGELYCEYLVGKYDRGFGLELYPTMTNTFTWLEKKGVLEKVNLTGQPVAEEVQCLEFTFNLHYFGKLIEEDPNKEAEIEQEAHSEPITVQITEENQIQELCKKLYFVYN